MKFFLKFLNTKKKKNICVSLIFLLLTLICCHNVILHFTTHIPGGYGDAIQNLAQINRRAAAINLSGVEGLVSFFKLIYSDPLQLFSLFFWRSILAKFIGTIAAYNFFWILSFFLASIAMYSLAYYYTKNRYASFIAGFLYSFAPYHFAYGNGFAGAMQVEWLPFYVLFFIKFLKKFTWKNLLLTFLFLLLLINEHHYLYFALILSLFLIIANLIPRFFKKAQNKISKKEIAAYIIVLIMIVGSAAFALKDFIQIAVSENNNLKVELGETLCCSNDVASFFTPSENHPLWGNLMKQKVWPRIVPYKTEGGVSEKHRSEITAYLSFSGLFFAILALFCLKKAKNKALIIPWILISFFFFLLSLGPKLSFFGPLKIEIPLLHVLFYKYLPFMNNIRAIARSFTFGFLGFCLLVSFGINFAMTKINVRKRKFLMAFVFVAFFLELQYLVPQVSAKLPDFINFLRQDQKIYSIINVNSSVCYICASQFDYYNSAHNKFTLGGLVYSRPTFSYWFEKNTPFIKELLYNYAVGSNGESSVIKHDFKSFANDLLTSINVRYLVIDKKWVYPDNQAKPSSDALLSASEFKKLNRFIETNLKTKIFWNDKEFLVYEVLPENKKDYVLVRQPVMATNLFKFRGDFYYNVDVIDFKNGDFLEYVNYKNDTDLLLTFVMKSQSQESFEATLNINGIKKSFVVRPEYERYFLYYPEGAGSGKITFEVPENKIVTVKNVSYEAKNHGEYLAEINNLIQDSDKKALLGPYSFFEFGDSARNNLSQNIISLEDLRNKIKVSYGAKYVLTGEIDWDKASDDKKPYTNENYQEMTRTFFKENGIDQIIVEKSKGAFDQVFYDYLVGTLKMFQIKKESKNFTLYEITN